MTYKKAIAIGLLASAGIGLLVFGIKTGKFKKENIGKTTTPISYNLNKKRNTPLQVNADDVLPISTKWLMNYEQPISNSDPNYVQVNQNANFTSWRTPNLWNGTYNAIQYNYNNITKSYNNSDNYSLIYSNTEITSNRHWAYRYQDGTKWSNNSQRIINFENEPTGNLYTYLTKNGQPAYNNDILMVNNSNYFTFNGWNGIQQIRKSNIIIENQNITNGAFINESAPITIYLDAGITHLCINGTDYINNLDSAINITNQDIIIAAQGTTTGQFYKTFTINYFNTRPAITPQPYPDASGKVTEVLDITGLMFQILTMPFTFISQAFNLTLWEGTPYQFNFSNFIVSLISIATIIFIIKLFTSGFSVVGNYTSHRADTKLKNSQTKLNKAKTKKIESKTPKKE